MVITLENQLLEALSKSEGEILQNVKLINTLETIKTESSKIQQELEQSKDTLLEIEEVLDIYRPLSLMSSKVFFTLQAMSNIHYLYQSSLA